MTTPVPSFLNLYRVCIPGTDFGLYIWAKSVVSAKGKFWYQIGNPAFLHAKPVATLIKRGGES